MNLLITSPSAIAEVNLSFHLYDRIWEMSLKVARIFFSCDNRWPGMLSDLEIYSKCLDHYLMETVKCRSVVVCVVCDLWQEKTNTQLYPWVLTDHLVMDHPPLMEHTAGDGQMFQTSSQCTSILSSLTQLWHWVCVLKEKGSLWCLEQIWYHPHWFWYVYAGFTLCCPEWHLALFVLINHWSWHSSILPVRWWGGSRSEVWTSNAEQMKRCSLHQSFVEPDTAWSQPIAFWHLWFAQGLWPCFSVDKEKKVVSTTGFFHSW